MKKDMRLQELYTGCECLSLKHVSQFLHFPMSDEEKNQNDTVDSEYDKNIIYFSSSARNNFDIIFPPIYFWEKTEWRRYFKLSWFNRLPIAIKNIITYQCDRERGILDSCDFRDSDLKKIDAFMALISSAIDVNVNEDSEVFIEDYNYFLKIHATQFVWNDCCKEPWRLGWDLHFKNKNIWGRIKDSFNYVFGTHRDYCVVLINSQDANSIRGIVQWIQKTNKKEKNVEKNR